MGMYRIVLMFALLVALTLLLGACGGGGGGGYQAGVSSCGGPTGLCQVGVVRDQAAIDVAA